MNLDQQLLRNILDLGLARVQEAFESIALAITTIHRSLLLKDWPEEWREGPENFLQIQIVYDWTAVPLSWRGTHTEIDEHQFQLSRRRLRSLQARVKEVIDICKSFSAAHRKFAMPELEKTLNYFDAQWKEAESYINHPTFGLAAELSPAGGFSTEESAGLLHVKLAACSSNATDHNELSHRDLISISVPSGVSEKDTGKGTDSIASSLAGSIEEFVRTHTESSECARSLSEIAHSCQQYLDDGKEKSSLSTILMAAASKLNQSGKYYEVVS